MFAADPFQPGARPVGGEFPPTIWFVKLPFQIAGDRRVVCMFEVNSVERVVTCYVLNDLREPI